MSAEEWLEDKLCARCRRPARPAGEDAPWLASPDGPVCPGCLRPGEETGAFDDEDTEG